MHQREAGFSLAPCLDDRAVVQHGATSGHLPSFSLLCPLQGVALSMDPALPTSVLSLMGTPTLGLVPGTSDCPLWSCCLLKPWGQHPVHGPATRKIPGGRSVTAGLAHPSRRVSLLERLGELPALQCTAGRGSGHPFFHTLVSLATGGQSSGPALGDTQELFTTPPHTRQTRAH